MNKKTLFTLFLFAVAVFFLCYDFPKDKEYLHRDGFIFGTVYSVTYSNPDNKDLSLQINSALEAVNASLSMFNPESTISKVNNNQPVELDLLFLTVWKTGQYVSDCTHGAFDMTVAPLVDLWGFGLKNRDVVTDAEVDSVREYVGYELVVLEDGVIHKAYPEMRIDAGAIAKGYACDVVADTLEAYGCTDFCIEIGGELVVKGLNSKGVNWHIAINKPVEDSLCVNREIQEVVELTDCGMATSSAELKDTGCFKSGNYRNTDGDFVQDKDGNKLERDMFYTLDGVDNSVGGYNPSNYYKVVLKNGMGLAAWNAASNYNGYLCCARTCFKRSTTFC